MTRKAALLSLFVLLACAQSDLIVNLPGLPNPQNYVQYAGYLTVDAASQRKLFYWFIESQGNPSQDPVVLWLNGGPGCSSLIGFLTENGPFRPSNDGSQLFTDPYTWNSLANMLYLEAPAGVGFSYSNNPNDYNTGDNQTASDNYVALQQFFKKYPQFQYNDFYISGESYAGHYVPQLADQVITGNENNNNIYINLRGILVGNGVTTNDIDLNSFVEMYSSHGMISFALRHQLNVHCNGNYINPPNPKCAALVNQIYQQIGNIDPYDIYAPNCLNSSATEKKSSSSYLGQIRFPHALQNFPFDPCIDLHITEYLNRADVRKAIHANPAITEWSECSNVVNYTFPMNEDDSMLPLYQKFLQLHDFRILIYSGDVDSVVPFIGSETWVDSLQQPLVQDWYPWMLGQEVGGYVKVFDKITFLTIRDAGHMVPYFQPARGFAFFNRFIHHIPF